MNRRRTVACYCATFLKPEMQHIYRQVSAVNRFQIKVFTQKRENESDFPFGEVVVVPKGGWRWLRRIIDRQIFRRPLLLSRNETDRLRVELRAHRCQLLHIFFGNVAVQLLPLLGEQTRRYPVIVSFHGADVLVEVDHPPYRQALLDMLGRVDLVLARSQSLLEALIRLGCPPEKIRVNRTGIPLAKFPFQARTWPTDGAWRLLQACRLIEKKGVATSLRAFVQFAKIYPLASFTVAGDGPDKIALQDLASELGIADKVRFAGFVSQDDLRKHLSEAHLFLHPSEQGTDGNQEGVPNSLLEAMATGLPVFATKHGGIPEAVENGVSGVLVAEKDHVALGQALIDAAANPPLLTAMSEAAAKAVTENFSLNVQARKLEDYYQEAMEEAWLGPENGTD